MGFYPSYLVALCVLWTFSSPRDRNALRIVLIAGVGSFLLMASVHWLQAPWKLVLPATVEALTVLSLLRWAKNPTGYTQASLLVMAWVIHALCYLDLMTGGNLVYDQYETYLGGIAIAQLLGFFDTLRFNYHRLVAILGHCYGHLRAGRGVAPVSPVEGGKSL